MTTIRSILAATDLTEASDDVVRSGAALASLFDAELHLIHAFDLQTLPYATTGGGSSSFTGRIDEARSAIEQQIERTTRAGVDLATSDVVIYAAHRAIVERAVAVKADLIVLGPHRRRGRIEELLGTTADRVVRAAESPCLIVRGPIRLPLRRVMVAVDLSPPSMRALEEGIRWSKSLQPDPQDPRPRPRIDVLHVLPADIELVGPSGTKNDVESLLRREVDSRAGRLGLSSPDVNVAFRQGDDVADRILAESADDDVDLLVLSTHGHGGLARALIGSVASSVVRRARCPVLIVPPEAENGVQAG